LLIEINCCEYLNTLPGMSASKKKIELVVVNPIQKCSTFPFLVLPQFFKSFGDKKDIVTQGGKFPKP
jgi:hypothetical protein